MTRELVLRSGGLLYRNLMRVYPADLRGPFGEEMLEAFLEDLEAACATRSRWRVWRVWRIALREVISVGPPEWFKNPLVAVPALTWGFLYTVYSPLLWKMWRTGNGPAFLNAIVIVSIAAFLAAGTSLAAVWRWERSQVLQLGIGR